MSTESGKRPAILCSRYRAHKKLTAIIFLACGLCPFANADVWKWVDAVGDTHYVDTSTPIYTWLDDYGKVHYSDKPDHPNAVAEIGRAHV